MKRKTMTLVLCLLAALALVSVGFASWVISADAQGNKEGQIIVDAVVEKEKLEITDKELEDGLKEAAEKYGMSVEDFEKEIGSKELFKYDLLMRKAMEIVTK